LFDIQDPEILGWNFIFCLFSAHTLSILMCLAMRWVAAGTFLCVSSCLFDNLISPFVNIQCRDIAQNVSASVAK